MLVESLRKLSIQKLFAVPTFSKNWPKWQNEIRVLIGKNYSADNILNIADSLRDIVKSTTIKGRGQSELAGVGAAWECLARGINHGKTMQFLRRFDKNMQNSSLLWEETLNDCWSKEFEDGKMYESGEEWLQVTATEDGVVMIAAGSAGLGIYNPTNCEINYLGRAGQSARFISLIELDTSLAVAFENKDHPLPYQWEIEVFSTNGSAKFSYMQLNSQEFSVVK